MTRGNKPLEPKFFWYFLSFVIPLLGFMLGIIYMSITSDRGEREPEVRAFGKNCLISAIAGIFLCGLCYFIFFVCNVGF